MENDTGVCRTCTVTERGSREDRTKLCTSLLSPSQPTWTNQIEPNRIEYRRVGLGSDLPVGGRLYVTKTPLCSLLRIRSGVQVYVSETSRYRSQTGECETTYLSGKVYQVVFGHTTLLRKGFSTWSPFASRFSVGRRTRTSSFPTLAIGLSNE